MGLIGWSWPISQGYTELLALGYFFYRNLFSISFPLQMITSPFLTSTIFYKISSLQIPPKFMHFHTISTLQPLHYHTTYECPNIIANLCFFELPNLLIQTPELNSYLRLLYRSSLCGHCHLWQDGNHSLCISSSSCINIWTRSSTQRKKHVTYMNANNRSTIAQRSRPQNNEIALILTPSRCTSRKDD
jgi:hypothetical protein